MLTTMATTGTTESKGRELMLTIIQTIREAKVIPSGHLYAVLMGVMTLETYNVFIGVLERERYVKVDGSHLITWTGN